jgi:hypothetical protein
LFPTANDSLISNLDTFPTKDSSKVMRIARGGQLTTIFIDFETILGLAVDKKGRIYVLENATGNPFPTRTRGKLSALMGKTNAPTLRRGCLADRNDLRSGRHLYVSAVGFGPPPVGLDRS